MDHVHFCTKGTHYLTLEVPGLAERRPSVVNGDSVFVRSCSEYENDDKFEVSFQVLHFSSIHKILC